MRIHIRLITPDIILPYNLNYLLYQDGWINMGIIRGIYGLPQADILIKNLLAQRLSNHGYYQVKKHQDFGDMCGDLFNLHL